MATTWPTTSTRWSVTAQRSCPTSCWPTTASTPGAPEGWLGEPVRLRWPPASTERGGPRLVLDDLVDPANAHRHDPARLADAVIGVWEREGGHRRRQGAARVDRAS